MNLKLSAAGFAFQSVKGTPATEPKWYHPVEGGKLVEFPIDQKTDDMTAATLTAQSGEYRESVAAAGGWSTRAYAASIVAYAYAVLGAIATTGSTTKTHTVTPAGSLPWATLFGKKDTDYKKAGDAKCDELTVEWDGNGRLKVTPVWAACTPLYDEDGFTPVLDETTAAKFAGLGLTAVVDINGSSYDGGGKVLGGKVTIKRNLESDIVSGSITPDQINEGDFEVEFELKYRVPDLKIIRMMVTGTDSGTTASATVLEGDCSLAFASGSTSVTIAGDRIAWQTDEPDADPKGGPGELTLKGRCYGNFSIVGVNTVASYTS